MNTSKYSYLSNVITCVVLTGYNISLFAIYPSIILWLSALACVCMTLLVATDVSTKEYNVKCSE